MNQPLSSMDIYDIITGNLFASNIENADERMECAQIIAKLISSDRRMKAPRDGVLLHFAHGDGETKLHVMTDPPGGGIKRVLEELAEALNDR